MNEQQRFLDTIDVAAPCPASWDAMTGDDRVRFCGDCKLNVYNLSGMTELQATDLVQQAEGRLCIRFQRRADGTVLTEDCPVGLAALRRKARLAYARVVALLGLMVTGLFGCTKSAVPTEQPPTQKHDPVILQGEAVTGICAPATPVTDPVQMEPAQKDPVLMGKIQAPPREIPDQQKR